MKLLFIEYMNLPMYLQFIYAAVATCGFSMVFNISSKRLLFAVSIVGGISWLVYLGVFMNTDNAAFAAFLAASTVSAFAEILARKMRQPAILFSIPGILPLVPGISLYNTMLNIIQKNYEAAAQTGATAFLMGGGIALGLLVVTSIARTFNVVQLKHNIKVNAKDSYTMFMEMGKSRTGSSTISKLDREISVKKKLEILKKLDKKKKQLEEELEREIREQSIAEKAARVAEYTDKKMKAYEAMKKKSAQATSEEIAKALEEHKAMQSQFEEQALIEQQIDEQFYGDD